MTAATAKIHVALVALLSVWFHANSRFLLVSSLHAVCLKTEPKGVAPATGAGGRHVAPTLFPPERPAQRHGLTMYRFGVASRDSGPQASCLSARNRNG